MTLSPQQTQILAHLSAGKRHKEIADALDLSPRTVGSYVARLRGKFGVQSTLELVALFAAVRPPADARKRPSPNGRRRTVA